MNYLKSVGFDKVHIVSDHENLYEKNGFEIIDYKTAPWGSVENLHAKIDVKPLIDWNEPNSEGCIVSDMITKKAGNLNERILRNRLQCLFIH